MSSKPSGRISRPKSDPDLPRGAVELRSGKNVVRMINLATGSEGSQADGH
jgi:hypothetical protein